MQAYIKTGLISKRDKRRVKDMVSFDLLPLQKRLNALHSLDKRNAPEVASHEKKKKEW